MAKELFKRLGVPILIALAMAFFCQPIYMAGEECDYLLMMLLIGIPFGIHKIIIWFPLNRCSIASTAGILALGILLSGFIGIFVFAFRMISGIAYISAAVTRTVFNKKEGN